MTRPTIADTTAAIHAAACGCTRTPGRCSPKWRAAAHAATTTPAPRPRRRHVPEPPAYLAMVRRLIRSAGQRVAVADPEHVADLCAVRDELDRAILHAVTGVRRSGFTWQSIGDACGITRQSAAERWARLIPTDEEQAA